MRYAITLCGVRSILFHSKGMLDAMWQTAAYWMMVLWFMDSLREHNITNGLHRGP